MNEQHWATVIDYIKSARARLETAQRVAGETMLTGPGNADANQAAAMRLLVQGQRSAGHDLTFALDRAKEVAPPEPPARPLEAVLADIEAEGHDWRLEGPNYPSRDSGYFIATKRTDKSHEDEAAEGGRIYGIKGDALSAVAEACLTQLRELHAARVVEGEQRQRIDQASEGGEV